MGEVVPARTSPTLHPPIPSHCAVLIQFKSVTVHQLSRLVLKELMTGDEMFIDDNGIVVPIRCTSEKICNGIYKLHRKVLQKKISLETYYLPVHASNWLSTLQSLVTAQKSQ